MDETNEAAVATSEQATGCTGSAPYLFGCTCPHCQERYDYPDRHPIEPAPTPEDATPAQ